MSLIKKITLGNGFEPNYFKANVTRIDGNSVEVRMDLYKDKKARKDDGRYPCANGICFVSGILDSSTVIGTGLLDWVYSKLKDNVTVRIDGQDISLNDATDDN